MYLPDDAAAATAAAAASAAGATVMGILPTGAAGEKIFLPAQPMSDVEVRWCRLWWWWRGGGCGGPNKLERAIKALGI